MSGAAPTAEPLALTQCRAFGVRFPRVFRRQFRLSRHASQGLRGFESTSCNGWTLTHCPSLSLTPISDIKGQACGYILGDVVGFDGEHLGPDHKLSANLSAPDFYEQATEVILKWSGRFVVLLLDTKSGQVHVDPAATFPLVYDPENGVIASSLLLALNRDIQDHPDYDNYAIVGDAIMHPDDTQRARADDRPAGGYSFGDTRDAKVKRLMANHTLDLSTFDVTRVWPRPQDSFNPIEDLELVGREISQRLRQNVLGHMGTDTATLALSGGLDSRMVLASLGAEVPSELEIYCHQTSWSSQLDAEIADQLAESLGKTLTLVSPPGDDIKRGSFNPKRKMNILARQYLLSTGYVNVLHPHIARGIYNWLPDDRLLLRGNALEMVTAVWSPKRPDVPLARQITHALRRCQVQMADEEAGDLRRSRYIAWRDALPAAAQSSQHDLNYVENTLPYTQTGTLFPAHFRYVAPAVDRRIFELCMRVPAPIRQSQDLFRQVMKAGNASLLEIPTVIELRRKLIAEANT